MVSLRLVIVLLLFCWLNTSTAIGQEVTYAEHIAPILLTKCGNCHREGNIGSFSLLTYEDAFSYRDAIYQNVLARRMPPWKPDYTYSHFLGENNRILCNEEMELIKTWVENECPPGNLSQVPPVPDYDNLLDLGTPDATFQIATYNMPLDGDMYRCMVIPNDLPEEKYMTAAEFFPANKSIVHHIVLYYDTLATALQLDENDPGIGYTCFGSATSITANMVAQWGPGGRPTIMPEGMGLRIKPNGYFIMQMHYSGLANEKDSTLFEMHFAEAGANLRKVSAHPFINHVLSIDNPPFLIPANTAKTITATWQICDSISIISVAPHMHLLGQHMSVYALVPAPEDALPCHNTIIPNFVNLPGYHATIPNTLNIVDTIPIVRVNDWDFHWQGAYTPKHPIVIPKNSFIRAEGYFDNNTNANVVGGENTTDEMLATLFFYTPYKAGDETAVYDVLPPMDPDNCQSVGVNPINETPNTYLNISPNPVEETANLSYYLATPQSVKLNFYNIAGQLVKTYTPNQAQMQKGYHQFSLDAQAFESGEYVCTIVGEQGIVGRKLFFVK